MSEVELRCERAVKSLTLQRGLVVGDEYVRIGGLIEGVELALSYIRDVTPIRPLGAEANTISDFSG